QQQFHGQLARSQGWDLGFCAKCHGADLTGGAAKASCTTCHTEGPTSCKTCHGQPPDTGAHTTHAGGGALGKTFDCTECHTKPAAWSDPGHVKRADGTADAPPAELTFGALAATTLDA